MTTRRRSFSTGHRSAWEKLGERTRLMLQRLNDSILLSENDLCALVWPEAVSQQARTKRLARWLAEQYLQPIAIPDGRCYHLSRRGACLLREAGLPRIAASPTPSRCSAGRPVPSSLTRSSTTVAPTSSASAQALARAWRATLCKDSPAMRESATSTAAGSADSGLGSSTDSGCGSTSRDRLRSAPASPCSM